MTITLLPGDCIDHMAALAAEGVLFDSVVCDPPYHLSSIVKRFGAEGAAPAKPGATGAYVRASKGFMGKQWDGGDIAFRPETWRLALDLLKPGGHLVAFGSTRNYHRMACAIEDAGFEIRDCIFWCFGSGFPKSHDVSKGIDRAAGAEREITGKAHRLTPRAMAPGGKGQRTCAPGIERNRPATPEAEQWQGWGSSLKPAVEPIVLARRPLSEKNIAANVLRWGTGAINVDATRIPADGVDLGRNNHARTNGTSYVVQREDARIDNSRGLGRWPANLVHDGSAEVLAGFPEGRSAGEYPSDSEGTGNGVTYCHKKPQGALYSDSGSAARFFYQCKANGDERFGSKHPTVKPLDLMRWLCRLITPPGGHILDMFAGTGSTGIAALGEGFRATLIEREPEYVADIQRRLDFVNGKGGLAAIEKARLDTPEAKASARGDDTPLFGQAA